MRVRLTNQVSGSRDGQSWPAAGTEVDLPDAEARAMIAGGNAVDASEEQHMVLVSPAGVHQPGEAAYTDIELVETPAESVRDIDAVRRALDAAAEGNVVTVPREAGTAAKDGSALPREEIEKEADRAKQIKDDLVGPGVVGGTATPSRKAAAPPSKSTTPPKESPPKESK
jgi:hypothetical protein